MKVNKEHITILSLIMGLFFLAVPGELSAQPNIMDDSIQVEELLVLDTVGLQIPGPSNDVAFYMNGLVFLSNTKFHQDMIPEHITFGQVSSYLVPLEYIALESSKPLFPNDPFPYSPAGTSYSRDYRKVYFTKVIEISGKRKVEKIFEMPIINGQASVYDQLPFTAGPTRYLHPAISSDGTYIVFASDLAPSRGGLDLFIARKTEGGWSIPVNLGENINTSGHEWYPFLDQHNNLFFSSSGHMGYGGFDIYVSLFNGEGWDKPKNLSRLINTEKDELGFSIHPGRKLAVFSTSASETLPVSGVYKLGLNKSAFVLAGIETENQDISLLLKDLVSSGYTSARYGAASRPDLPDNSLTALPLIFEDPIEPESEPEPVVQAEQSQEIVEEPPPPVIQAEESQEIEEETPVPVVQAEESQKIIEEDKEATLVPVIAEVPEQAVPEPEPRQDPDRLVFRVQIISAPKANTRPSVTIDGSSHETWEYFYKGAYRITVGEYETVQEALAFRTKCKNSGYNQAFVAAFRGNERETDPSVFKR